MNLIPNWRQAWRWWSVRVSALGTILLALAIAAPDFVAGAWALLPAEILAMLPRNVALIVPLLIQAGTGLARILRQRGLAPVIDPLEAIIARVTAAETGLAVLDGRVTFAEMRSRDA